MTLVSLDLKKQNLQQEDNFLDTSKFGPLTLAVIQPTSFCNLDCDYCYLPDRHLKNQLSLDLIDPICQAIFNSPFTTENFTICWHAGEPLAASISFYREAFKLIAECSQKYNHKNLQFNHSFQTNAILINQDWCDLFKEFNVDIGVSIDGPDFIHDAHRKTRTGLGSHAAAMRGIEYLQKNEICHNVIAVLTEDSVNYPDEIFNFFYENNLRDVGFNMEETEGIHLKSSLEKEGVVERYRAFMKRFWELTTQSEGEFQVREFEAVCGLIYTEERLSRTDMNHPFVIVSIDNQGNFSTFDPELLSVKTEKYGDFVFGNVLTDSFESVCQTEKFRNIYHDINAGVELCRQTCDYFGLCGGGAGSNKYWEKGTFNCAETMACRYRIKEVSDIVIEAFENSLGLE
ncbi:MAG: cyclophane-forming radical SAM/SPASM peptide maturase GrrM/OscB [Snowella sp.]|nr:cyclophane-forming radical SAM/SPASM peptide maturase GrrM/OscB [Snowella sp.]